MNTCIYLGWRSIVRSYKVLEIASEELTRFSRNTLAIFWSKYKKAEDFASLSGIFHDLHMLFLHMIRKYNLMIHLVEIGTLHAHLSGLFIYIYIIFFFWGGQVYWFCRVKFIAQSMHKQVLKGSSSSSSLVSADTYSPETLSPLLKELQLTLNGTLHFSVHYELFDEAATWTGNCRFLAKLFFFMHALSSFCECYTNACLAYTSFHVGCKTFAKVECWGPRIASLLGM